MIEEIKETVPFSFDEIYQGIAQKFADLGYDSPYDGSNLAQLITSMAYTTSMLNSNTAININETLLTLAQKRPNIVQDARLLGYEAQQKISYIYELTIHCTENKIYTIPHFMKFTKDTKEYYYTGDDFEFDATGTEKDFTIKVKEGKLIKHEDEPTNLKQVIANKQYLDIPYTDIENDGIEVYVTAYTPDGILKVREKYFKSPTLLIDKDDDISKKFIRLENVDMDTPRIYFVLSDVGNVVPTGAIVEMNIIISSAKDGALPTDENGVIQPPDTDFPDVQVIGNPTLLVKGNTVETNESIRNNAPVLHNTASRCVTANDYAVVSKKHSACAEAFIYGGEDEHPIKLGNLFLTLTPEKMTREFLSDNEKTLWTLKNNTDILNNYLLPDEIESNQLDIDGNIKDPGVLDTIKALNLPALRYNIRNPHYLFVDLDITVVKYALASVHKDVRSQIFNIVDAHFKTIESFQTEFFKSSLIKKIDEYLTDITGLEMDVKFQIMVDEKSVTKETQQAVQEQQIVDVIESAVYIYLDTPYEGLYEDNGYIILNNLPKIDTLNFIDNKDLIVDFTNPIVVPDVPGIPGGNDLTKGKDSISFPIYLDNVNIGTYDIYNDRKTYIRIKLITDTFESDLSTARFIDLKYPTSNIKTLRGTTFKLNKVQIH